MSRPGAFDLLAEPIQRVLWDMRWTELRPIQTDAIHQILGGTNDLIIAASTASGKTEAAFLPILSRIVEEPGHSVRAVYVGPLKALINDQFRRLEDLCNHAEIPVHRWHGDVSGSAKSKLIQSPSGVLLITPESIESLFVNRSTQLVNLFRDLEYVVIDEIHAFVGIERGTHLRSLLYRIEQFSDRAIRLVGLSATLGDPRNTAAWYGSKRAENTQIIKDDSEKSIRYKIYAFKASKPVPNKEAQESGETRDRQAEIELIFDHFRHNTNLIFANSKSTVEETADKLNQINRHRGMAEQFLVHHGSLSKEIREFTETEMRSARPTTGVCSSTLELGIDIGDVEAVGQIGPCWSVSSLVQRLGRSGRRDGKPSVMRVYIPVHVQPDDTDLVKQLCPDLLRAVALTELMLQKWVEPPTVHPYDLSTLLQQILSVLAQTGGIRMDRLHDRLIRNGGFAWVEREVALNLVRDMAAADLVEQLPRGDLVLGLEGQRLVKQFDFYSAFQTPLEFSVVHDRKPIGSLPAVYAPQPEAHLLLGGRRWVVEDVDPKRLLILVKPAKGYKPPSFLGAAGDIHAKVRQGMRQTIMSDKTYAYLDPVASEILDNARLVAREAGLEQGDLFAPSPKSTLWFTWTGTRTQRTLQLMAQMAGLSASDQDIALQFNADITTVKCAYSDLMQAGFTGEQLAERMPLKARRKYDNYISEPLLIPSLVADALDLEGARDCVRRLLQVK